MKITMYVLYGMWYTRHMHQSAVISISTDEKQLIKKLADIADNKARAYVEMYGYILEKKEKRNYEAMNGSSKYAEFHITEHQVDLPGKVMEEIGRELKKINRTSDAETYLDTLNESESIEPWKYEYMMRNPKVMQAILNVFEKAEDSNVAYNDTMEYAVKAIMNKTSMDDKKLEFLWEEFKSVPADDGGCILDDFLGFKRGTHWKEISLWFDRRYSGGLKKLMSQMGTMRYE